MAPLEYQMFPSQFKHCMLAELNLLIEKITHHFMVNGFLRLIIIKAFF